jgi:uracil-DNA glycosylase family 4
MTPVTNASADQRRALAQIAETTRLLGVDFLPISASTTSKAAATPAREPAAPARSQSPDPSLPRSPSTSKAAALAALRAEHDASCPHCTTVTYHTQTVFGDGDPDARLMFIGEAPGAEEDRQGIPFVGASGKKLNEMIIAMGLSRETVYIANVLKSRPPDNATPTPDEAAKCGPYLLRQIQIIKPAVIVTLGKPAANFLLENRDSMTSMRGRWFEHHGIPVMPTFHPAYLLRAYTPENRQKVWSDLKAAIAKLNEAAD